MSTRGFIALLGIVALLGIPHFATATTITECQADVSALRLQTQAATYLRDDQGLKLEQQLLFHLDKTSIELNRADTRDALKQMGDYSFTLKRGIESGKINATDGAALQTGADGVVACISTIGNP